MLILYNSSAEFNSMSEPTKKWLGSAKLKSSVPMYQIHCWSCRVLPSYCRSFNPCYLIKPSRIFIWKLFPTIFPLSKCLKFVLSILRRMEWITEMWLSTRWCPRPEELRRRRRSYTRRSWSSTKAGQTWALYINWELWHPAGEKHCPLCQCCG